MSKDREELRAELERDFGVSLPEIGCDPGWEVPLRRVLEEMRVRGLFRQVSVQQIKEKWGQLKVYTSRSGADPEELRAFDRRKARIEETTWEICEKCGAPGELKKGMTPFLTLCDNCQRKREPDSGST